MDVVFGRAVVGRDQGRLWFEPEALCFVGDHTSFALTSDLIDFIHVTRFKKPALPFERSLFVPIAGCPWSVQFDVTDRMKEQAYARLDRSITRLSFMPYSDEIRQLPPMAMGPGAASIAELFRASVTEMTALAFWFFAAFCFGVLSVDGMVGVDSLALVFMITVVLLGFRTTTCVRRLKALASVGRDLGRLRRMSRSK